jgi:hypothetical protein
MQGMQETRNKMQGTQGIVSVNDTAGRKVDSATYRRSRTNKYANADGDIGIVRIGVRAIKFD